MEQRTVVTPPMTSDEPAAPVHPPRNLLDTKQLSNLIATAMLHQVTTSLLRMQPMIAHEVQQQLESGVEDGLDSALLHAVAAPPPEIEPGDKYLHGVAMPNAVPSNGTRSKSNNNRSSSLHHYRIAEGNEVEGDEEHQGSPQHHHGQILMALNPLAESGESKESREEKTWRHKPPHPPPKRGDSKMSDVSGFSGSSTNSRKKMRAAKKAAMTLDIVGDSAEAGLSGMVARAIGVLPEVEEIPDVARTGSRKLSTVMARRISNTAGAQDICNDKLPKTVSGAWRRQAVVLAAEMREDMAEEVAMAKNNMSFRGGLWWLRQIVGLRALNRPYKALMISLILLLIIVVAESISLYLRLETFQRNPPANIQLAEHPVMQHLSDIGIFGSAAFGLMTHHFGVKLSDVGLPSGEQDQLLQAHSVGMRYVRSWLIISKKNGKYLCIAWVSSMITGIASRIYEAYSTPGTPMLQVVAGCVVFIGCSGIICALCMRVIHICSAMKTSLIRYMQNLAEDDIDLERMAQEWNTIQIFIRCLCDGCSQTLLAVVLVIPVMAAGTIFNLLYADSSLFELVATMLPFATVSSMPLLCLFTAADLTQQCEQAPQVANSMLVGEWDNSLAQDLLDFMSRCQLGFFVNDMRVSNAAVMKFTYVWVAVFFTILSWSAERIF